MAGQHDSRTMDDTFRAGGHAPPDARGLGSTSDGAPTTVGQIATDHLQALRTLLGAVELDALERVVERLRAVRDGGGTVYLAGNGGSAATASHWGNDLGRSTQRSGHQMRVMCLNDSIPWMTALANDKGYERVFAGQLQNFAREGDLLGVISASGSSANLIDAVETAHALGAGTVGLVGFDGGLLKGMVGECLWLPTEPGAYELVEDGHGVLCHILSTCLAHDRVENPVVTS